MCDVIVASVHILLNQNISYQDIILMVNCYMYMALITIDGVLVIMAFW